MWSILHLTLVILAIVQANLHRECGKLFNPVNYMDQLPSLNLPYISNVPDVPPIKPSPVVKTKVVNVVTKYLYQNPVCVKVSGNKSLCKPQNPKSNIERLVTKEYFVKDRKRAKEKGLDLESVLQGSEAPRPFSKQERTPKLYSEQVKEMLIEDRLDQLETILPHYTRRRAYQTSTITVTKVRSNNRATATLVVKNCVPQGYELCPPKVKQRKSKVARPGNFTDRNYFG